MHHPTDRIIHTTAFFTPCVDHWLEREIDQWVHHEGSIRRPITPWVNALTTVIYLAPPLMVGTFPTHIRWGRRRWWWVSLLADIPDSRAFNTCPNTSTSASFSHRRSKTLVGPRTRNSEGPTNQSFLLWFFFFFFFFGGGGGLGGGDHFGWGTPGHCRPWPPACYAPEYSVRDVM